MMRHISWRAGWAAGILAWATVGAMAVPAGTTVTLTVTPSPTSNLDAPVTLKADVIEALPFDLPAAGGMLKGEIAAGNDHACAIDVRGGVWCWGSGVSGQLGNGAPASSTVPVPVTGIDGSAQSARATAVAAGGSHACALMQNGSVRCWGANGSGQLGNGQIGGSAATPGLVSTLDGIANSVKAIAAGEDHTCAVLTTGALWCWGSDFSGQLGVAGGNASKPTPGAVAGLGGAGAVTEVAAGPGSTCAILSTGALTCWGKNDSGQLGNGINTNADTPVAVQVIDGSAAGKKATSVDIGLNHACAIVDTKLMYCWGSDLDGQMGNGAGFSSPTPVLVSAVTKYASVTAGHQSTCAIREDFVAECWGRNDLGQVGDNTATTRTAPVTVSGFSVAGNKAAAIAGFRDFTCAIRRDGTAVCWGANENGQLGTWATSQKSAVPAGLRIPVVGGTVAFSDDLAAPGAPSPVAGTETVVDGAATRVLAALPLGSYSIKAAYTPADLTLYGSSQSAAKAHKVVVKPTLSPPTTTVKVMAGAVSTPLPLNAADLDGGFAGLTFSTVGVMAGASATVTNGSFVYTAPALPSSTSDTVDVSATDADGLKGWATITVLIGLQATATDAGGLLEGGFGDDDLAGAGGVDTITGGPGNDVIEGGPGGDTLDGGSDDDLLQGGAGDDQLDGGTGTDTAVYADPRRRFKVTVSQDGSMSVEDLADKSPLGTDTLTGIEKLAFGNVTVDDGFETGNNQPPTIGTWGPLMPGAAWSKAVGEVSPTMVVAADDPDAGDVPVVVSVDGGAAVTAAIVDAAARTFTLQRTDAWATEATVSVCVKDLYGAPQCLEDTIPLPVTGTAGDGGETITGGALADTIDGGGGDDMVSGGGGDDSLLGGAGNDILNGGSGDDTLSGGPGDDALSGGPGDDGFDVDSTGDTVQEQPGEGDDTVTATVSFTLPENVERLILAGTGPIAGTGNGLANTITGNDGANVLKGLGGDDTISAGKGNDVVEGGAGTDVLDGGAGTDALSFAGSPAGVTADLAAIVVSGGKPTLTVAGDAIALDAAGLSSFETLIGSPFADRLFGDGRANRVDGGAGNDVIDGRAGADTLSGGTGADRLTGGAGRDTLAGGSGGDGFVFARVADSARAAPDTILDFGAGDRIDLTRFDGNLRVRGLQRFTRWRGTGAFTGRRYELRFVARTSRLEGDVNGDRRADFVVVLKGRRSLAATAVKLR